MALPGFFRQKKPRGFNFIPRYYNPAMEEREERKKLKGFDKDVHKDSAKSEADAPGSTGTRKIFRPTIHRGSFRSQGRHSGFRGEKRNTVVLIVIILLLLFVTYIYFRL